jgi:pimeloyl-ACP methyl ester carboxylesterase
VPASGDPFHTTHAVPVGGGSLHVAQAGPPPGEADAVVLAVHGISASGVAWRAVARELAGRVSACVLAPDLRGRGRSAGLPHERGFPGHAEDMVAVLDHLGVERAVLVGHSMGAWVTAVTAAEHPARAGAVVLVDGGVPLRLPPGLDPDAVLDATLGPSIARLRMTMESREEWTAFWRRHPSFAGEWNEDMDAYVRADLTGKHGAVRSVVSEAAVRADGRSLLVEEATRTAAERIAAPLWVLRAPRGLLNDDRVQIPEEALRAFRDAVPHATTELVDDVNHYMIVMGAGAPRVAAAIESAIAASRRR